MVKIDFELPRTDEDMRLVLWESFIGGQEYEFAADTKEIAAKFRFTPGQIAAAVRRSTDLARLSGEKTISEESLHKCCYDQVVVGLNTLATPIKPAYSWDDLVLPESEVRQLKEACAHVKYRHTVYNEWGLGRRAAYGRGLSVLFSGPPGTGKTMAAQVVTNQLHMQMYKIQLSQIVSKYIGETEKNLRQVFTEAGNANCILFFDEMDALFGKRSEVKDSHDRNANIETAYLLQQMEEYDGVILMATNLLQNIDEAFMRRINFVISFPFPDVRTRKLLWEKMLDTGAPISDDVDLDFLAKSFKLAGGNIKNCAVHAAFLAAAEDKPVSMKHLISSIVSEQRKNNVVVLREDLKEYADMVFGEK
jgi:SpoVK/Ycf46/Vps4 family AAA+-type ATPase